MPFLSGSSNKLRGVNASFIHIGGEQHILSFEVNMGKVFFCPTPKKQTCKDIYALLVPGGFAKLQDI